jgi:hypothetical protein
MSTSCPSLSLTFFPLPLSPTSAFGLAPQVQAAVNPPPLAAFPLFLPFSSPLFFLFLIGSLRACSGAGWKGREGVIDGFDFLFDAVGERGRGGKEARKEGNRVASADLFSLSSQAHLHPYPSTDPSLSVCFRVFSDAIVPIPDL